MQRSRTLVLIGTLILIRTASPQAAVKRNREGLSCPGSIHVSETATPKSPFTVLPSQATHLLSTANVLNVVGRDEFELKPDDEHKRQARTILTWNLDAYRDHALYLRCVYHDTPVKFSVQLPSVIHNCTATLTLNSKNHIIGSTTVECH